MSWLVNLAKTYDCLMAEKSMGKNVDSLIPIGHNTQNAQVSVTIDENGNFIDASLIIKDEAPTLLPVTETSAMRTAGASPHALFDTLWYLAGDLPKFSAKPEKQLIKMREECFNPYMENLKDWIDFSTGNKRIAAVYNYLKKETLVQDLVERGILVLDKGFLDEAKKIEGVAQDKVLVRFSVEKKLDVINLWEDSETQQDYVNYITAKKEKGGTDLCYATGKNLPIARLHSKFIRFSGDGAKLISSNDSTNYTFRGRFIAPNEAMGVSSDISDKAHFALRWLISKYSFQRDGYTIVAWNNDGSEALSPLVGTDKLMEQLEQNIYQKPLENISVDSNNYINKVMKGLKPEKIESVSVMILNAATPGRLAIHYYREFEAKDYYERLSKWHSSMQWPRRKSNSETMKHNLELIAPSLYDIINVAFGTEQGQFLKTDDSLLKPSFSRLLPCVLEGKRLPEDMVRSAARRAIRYESMSDNNWWKSVNVACALIKKYRNEKLKEEWDVSLNKECNNRSYLYGRLLAVVDAVEEYSNYQKNVERSTAAKRLLSAFSKRPHRTWGTIYKGLQPYMQSLSERSQRYYQNLIADIMDKFEPNDFEKPSGLEEVFLLGYFHQLKDMKPSKNIENNNPQSEDDESNK